MARPVRVEFEGAIYHVMARGNQAQEIFLGDKDRLLFCKTLEEMIQRFGIRLHGYCLMPNHYHLVIETPSGNLSQAVGWLQVTYTVRFNRLHKRIGHLFQGRFKAVVVDADEYARSLLAYIHLNPVRKKIADVKGESLESWKRFEKFLWSSHGSYASDGKQKAVAGLYMDWLSYWGRSKAQARREYLRDLRRRVFTGEIDELKPRGGLVLGGEKLWEWVNEMIKQKQGAEEMRWSVREDQGQRKKQLDKFLKDEKDDRLMIWARVRLGGKRLVDLAREKGYRDGSSVLQVVKRVEKKGHEKPSLKEAFRRLEEKYVKCQELTPFI